MFYSFNNWFFEIQMENSNYGDLTVGPSWVLGLNTRYASYCNVVMFLSHHVIQSRCKTAWWISEKFFKTFNVFWRKFWCRYTYACCPCSVNGMAFFCNKSVIKVSSSFAIKCFSKALNVKLNSMQLWMLWEKGTSYDEKWSVKDIDLCDSY